MWKVPLLVINPESLSMKGTSLGFIWDNQFLGKTIEMHNSKVTMTQNTVVQLRAYAVTIPTVYSIIFRHLGCLTNIASMKINNKT